MRFLPLYDSGRCMIPLIARRAVTRPLDFFMMNIWQRRNNGSDARVDWGMSMGQES